MAWPDPRAVRAAANNASWCATVCRAHGIPGTLAVGQWRAAAPPPPFYPDTVTLVPGLAPAEVAESVPDRRGASVKDSFADVDLGGEGFEVLFEAQWIWRSQQSADGAPDLVWGVVDTAAALAVWAEGSGQAGTFGPQSPGRALVENEDVRFLLGHRGDVVVGRAALYAAAGVVGVSNVWAGAPGAWGSLAGTAGRLFPGQAVAGYESGAGLAAALAGGFEAVGPLRVWVRA
jgi:hypothetical protein